MTKEELIELLEKVPPHWRIMIEPVPGSHDVRALDEPVAITTSRAEHFVLLRPCGPNETY